MSRPEGAGSLANSMLSSQQHAETRATTQRRQKLYYESPSHQNVAQARARSADNTCACVVTYAQTNKHNVLTNSVRTTTLSFIPITKSKKTMSLFQPADQPPLALPSLLFPLSLPPTLVALCVCTHTPTPGTCQFLSPNPPLDPEKRVRTKELRTPPQAATTTPPPNPPPSVQQKPRQAGRELPRLHAKRIGEGGGFGNT